jgi:ABC-type branched-subunit amino acid transport system substrate-binding protein
MTQQLHRAKALLLQLIEEMNAATEQGYKIEFVIETDPNTQRSKMGRFTAYQQVKMDN